LQQKALNMTFGKNVLGPRADLVIARTSEDSRKRQKILNKRRQEQARYFQQKKKKKN